VAHRGDELTDADAAPAEIARVLRSARERSLPVPSAGLASTSNHVW